MCKCIRCQKPCDCEWKICDVCYMEDCCKTPVEKNLFVGGRFYGEKLIKPNTNSVLRNTNNVQRVENQIKLRR